MPAAARRHPLLLYVRLFALWRVPALLILLICAALAYWAPGPLDTIELRAGMVGLSGISLLVFIYAYVGPALSFVECRPDHLLLSTPLFRLAISYNRIRITRPIPFDSIPVRGFDQRLAAPFRGRTMLGVDLTGYPIRKRWLRFWLMDYLLPATFVGFQFLVPDWMALSRDIEGQRAEWKTRRRHGEREEGLTSLTGRPRY